MNDDYYRHLEPPSQQFARFPGQDKGPRPNQKLAHLKSFEADVDAESIIQDFRRAIQVPVSATPFDFTLVWEWAISTPSFSAPKIKNLSRYTR
jgi:hypothetical protein